jgi:hypothetical protein
VDRTVPRRTVAEDEKSRHGLIENGDLEIADRKGRTPNGFDLTGDCIYNYLGDPTKDRVGWGVRFASARDVDRNDAREGRLTYTVRNLDSADGRWFRFHIRGLAQPSFSSSSRQLFLQAEFFAKDGENALDSVSQNLYGQIEQARRDRPSGDTGPEASAIWQTYAMEFRTPFPEVDTLRVSVGFKDGNGDGDSSEFLVDDVQLERIPDPADYVAAIAEREATPQLPPPALARLTPLGGRWYYDPRDDNAAIPKQFDWITTHSET